MSALDAINARFGRGAVHLAAEGIQQPWKMRRGKLSPRYTTCWEELARVKS